MSTGNIGGDPVAGGREPTEEELRAAYEAEIKRIRVEQVLFEHVVTLVNLGMRKTGMAPGTEDERDLGQVRMAIEAIRVQLPLLEQSAQAQAGPIREALSQLQLAFVKLGGSAEPEGAGAPPESSGAAPEGGPGPEDTALPGSGSQAGGEPGAEAPKAGEAGPAQRSGRLWVPGT